VKWRTVSGRLEPTTSYNASGGISPLESEKARLCIQGNRQSELSAWK
jgi:hypothetical protein